MLMKKVIFTLNLLIFAVSSASSQNHVVVGFNATNIVVDSLISYGIVSKNIDIDGNGSIDFTFSEYSSSYSQPFGPNAQSYNLKEQKIVCNPNFSIAVNPAPCITYTPYNTCLAPGVNTTVTTTYTSSKICSLNNFSDTMSFWSSNLFVYKYCDAYFYSFPGVMPTFNCGYSGMFSPSPITTTYFSYKTILNSSTVYGWFKVEAYSGPSAGHTLKFFKGDTTSYNTVALSFNETNASQSNSLFVFPNPSTNQLNVGGSELENSLSISLFDSNGQVVLKESLRDKKVVNIETIKSGFYICRIETSKDNFITKIIVQRN